MSTLSRADSSQIAEERILEEQLKGRSSKKTKKKKKSNSPFPRLTVSVKLRVILLVTTNDEFLCSSSSQQGDHHESSLPEHVCRHVQGRLLIHLCCTSSHMQDWNSTLSVCRQTMVALDMDGKVRRPQFELDSEQVRYEHRFAPFNSVVTPPPVHYIQFKVLKSSHFNHIFCFFGSQTPVSLPWCSPPCTFQEMSDLKKYNPPPGSSDLYLAASKHFQQAKLILENVLSPDPEVRPCWSHVPFCYSVSS